jgi:hypothetical protein
VTVATRHLPPSISKNYTPSLLRFQEPKPAEKASLCFVCPEGPQFLPRSVTFDEKVLKVLIFELRISSSNRSQSNWPPPNPQPIRTAILCPLHKQQSVKMPLISSHFERFQLGPLGGGGVRDCKNTISVLMEWYIANPIVSHDEVTTTPSSSSSSSSYPPPTHAHPPQNRNPSAHAAAFVA